MKRSEKTNPEPVSRDKEGTGLVSATRSQSQFAWRFLVPRKPGPCPRHDIWGSHSDPLVVPQGGRLPIAGVVSGICARVNCLEVARPLLNRVSSDPRLHLLVLAEGPLRRLGRPVNRLTEFVQGINDLGRQVIPHELNDRTPGDLESDGLRDVGSRTGGQTADASR